MTMLNTTQSIPDYHTERAKTHCAGRTERASNQRHDFDTARALETVAESRDRTKDSALCKAGWRVLRLSEASIKDATAKELLDRSLHSDTARGAR